MAAAAEAAAAPKHGLSNPIPMFDADTWKADAVGAYDPKRILRNGNVYLSHTSETFRKLTAVPADGADGAPWTSGQHRWRVGVEAASAEDETHRFFAGIGNPKALAGVRMDSCDSAGSYGWFSNGSGFKASYVDGKQVAYEQTDTQGDADGFAWQCGDIADFTLDLDAGTLQVCIAARGVKQVLSIASSPAGGYVPHFCCTSGSVGFLPPSTSAAGAGAAAAAASGAGAASAAAGAGAGAGSTASGANNAHAFSGAASGAGKTPGKAADKIAGTAEGSTSTSTSSA